MYYGEDTDGTTASQQLKSIRERGMSRARSGRRSRETLKKKNTIDKVSENPKLLHKLITCKLSGKENLIRLRDSQGSIVGNNEEIYEELKDKVKSLFTAEEDTIAQHQWIGMDSSTWKALKLLEKTSMLLTGLNTCT